MIQGPGVCVIARERLDQSFEVDNVGGLRTSATVESPSPRQDDLGDMPFSARCVQVTQFERDACA